MRWNGTDEMKWNGWDEMEMEWMRWNRNGADEMKWNGWDEMEMERMRWNGNGTDEMKWKWNGWDEMEMERMRWNGMDEMKCKWNGWDKMEMERMRWSGNRADEMKWMNPNLVLVEFHLLSRKSVSTGRWFGELVPYCFWKQAWKVRTQNCLVGHLYKLDKLRWILCRKILKASNVPTALCRSSKVWVEGFNCDCHWPKIIFKATPPHLSSLGCCSANWGINQAV